MNFPSLNQWQLLLKQLNGHLLQSWTWGKLKSQFGWTPVQIQAENGAAQILFRRLPLGFTIGYIPKGPMIDWRDSKLCNALFAKIHTEAKNKRAIFLKIEPDILQTSGKAQSVSNYLGKSGFVTADTIQPQSTLIVDISPNQEAILSAMKQKTRYNIRLAKRKGVTVRHGTADDIPIFYQLAQLTAKRDGFGIHNETYYQAALDLFAPDHGTLLIAEFDGEPLAALIAFCHGKDAFYFYGASSNAHRNLMPTYLIQWEAICWAKNRGCTRYDLWGIPTATPDTLEAEFSHRHDGLWGVYRFKRGFGGRVEQSIGAYDHVYNPLLYKIYKLRRGV